MRWRMEEDIVETEDNVLRRLSCPLLEDDRAEGELHACGTLLSRERAPQECWGCRPSIQLVLGVQSRFECSLRSVCAR